MKGTIIGPRAAIAIACLGVAGSYLSLRHGMDRDASTTRLPATATAVVTSHPSFIHGRVTTTKGATYEGRLRFGGDEEAFWGDYFNGVKKSNPWADQVPAGALPKEHSLRRPIMVRFGDIARIEAQGRNLWVTLKSGTLYHLNRYAADDFADGVSIWDDQGNVVSLNERQIRAIDLFPATGSDATPPARLHGTVRTRHGEFTGFLQWNRNEGLSLDALNGRAADGDWVNVPYQTIRSITRHSRNSANVTLHDGRSVVLSDSREAGEGNGGVYVDDARYGRVLIPWNAFERVDFSEAGVAGSSGPAYSDFPVGRPLTGTVTPRGGRPLTGRLVFDLDESQATETLDAPAGGVDYTIPFGMVASIVLPRTGKAMIALQSGETLQLERGGDLGDGNAGMLIFAEGHARPVYVRWSDVERIDFDR